MTSFLLKQTASLDNAASPIGYLYSVAESLESNNSSLLMRFRDHPEIRALIHYDPDQNMSFVELSFKNEAQIRIKDLLDQWGSYTIIDQTSRDNIFIIVFKERFTRIKMLEVITRHRVDNSDERMIIYVEAVRITY